MIVFFCYFLALFSQHVGDVETNKEENKKRNNKEKKSDASSKETSFHDGLLVGEMSSSLSLLVIGDGEREQHAGEEVHRVRKRMLEVWGCDVGLERGLCRHVVSCGGGDEKGTTAMFCDWVRHFACRILFFFFFYL